MKRSFHAVPTVLTPLLLLLVWLTLSACQKVDATGERHLSLIGEQQEIAMGESSNEDIVRTMGLYEDEELQQYVQQLGMRIAATTERADLPWTFQVMDDDVVNAFALPGGYVYLTRGILGHFENEAQLVGVLSHEIAHVTAMHSVIRLSKAMIGQLGLGVATIAVPELREFSSLLGQGMQLLFLKFSRDDEKEADIVGIRYMLNVEENPWELVDVMQMLSRMSDTRNAGAIPQWAATHPLPENRKDYIATQIAGMRPEDFKPVERASYLRRLDGMVYGQNPREGFVKDNVFYHPDLQFQLAFPEGWQVVNQRRAVVAISASKDAAIQLTLGPPDDPRAALARFFRQSGIRPISSSASIESGMPAAEGEFLASTGQGAIRGRVSFIRYNDTLYQLVAYSPQRIFRRYAGAFRRSADSFASLQGGYRDVQPLRLRIVRLDSAMSLAEFHQRQNVPVEIDELARLNQIEADARLEAGEFLKSVVGRLP